MFKERSRSTVASVNRNCQGYNPFCVIIGGSDDTSTLNNCELYYPTTDSYYSFPSLSIPRENASSCVFTQGEELFIYCFGGFDKRAIENIERIQISFS
jgi:hypothetical protein